MIIKDMPREEKPREKMLYYGKQSLSNSELLALVIGSGARDKSAIDVAQDILAMDPDGLRYLGEVTWEELSELSGIGVAKATRVVASIELGKRLALAQPRSRSYLRDTNSAHEFFMERLRYYPKEVFSVALLDSKGGVMGIEDISVGDANHAIVQPRETFSGALRRGAVAVILAHNHPSGDPTPSQEDVDTTRRICEAGELLGIRVLDHIIIGDGTFFSFHRERMMPNP